MCKFFCFILSSFIIFCSSCTNKEIDLLGENVKELEELIEWSINHKPADAGVKKYRPVSSITLSDMVILEEGIDSIEHNQGIIIAVLYFNENEEFLNKIQKELLILVSKAQMFEDFNIIIESNNIKTIMPDIIGQIKENLLSNGIKNNYISLNYLNGSNKKLIIKLIKLL